MKETMKDIIRKEMKGMPFETFIETEKNKGRIEENWFWVYTESFDQYELSDRYKGFPRIPSDWQNMSQSFRYLEFTEMITDVFYEALLDVLLELYPQHRKEWTKEFESYLGEHPIPE